MGQIPCSTERNLVMITKVMCCLVAFLYVGQEVCDSIPANVYRTVRRNPSTGNEQNAQCCKAVRTLVAHRCNLMGGLYSVHTHTHAHTHSWKFCLAVNYSAADISFCGSLLSGRFSSVITTIIILL